MKKCLRKCRKILTFLLAVLLVYDGVKDATLMVAAENGGTDGQVIAAEEVGVDGQAAGVEDGSADGLTVAAENDGADVLAEVSGGNADDQTAVTENDAADGLAAVSASAAMGAGIAVDVGADNTGAEVAEEIFVTYVPDVEFPDNDMLFASYVEQLFYGEFDSGISFFGNEGVGAGLTGDEGKLYNTLKAAIKEIAAGDRASTKDISVEGLSNNVSDKDNLQAIMDKVVNYLLMDCPYDFYWYDKTAGVGCSGSGTASGITLNFAFAVASEYQGADANTVDGSKVEIAKTAAAKAKEIVEKYQGKSDYEKLVAYRQEICDLVAYNTAAAGNGIAYGNPWQLIWVFDNDSSTNVVCEGYSKAFQYLCDLSDFSNAVCYTVTGEMSGGTGAGGHMWNIITIDGKNYLVDVTNCDTGSIGAPDKLFLAGTAGSVAEGYLFEFDSLNRVKFTYDPDQKDLLGNVLELESENYRPKITYTLTVTAPTGVKAVFGDSVDDIVLKENVTATGSATAMVDGKEVTVEGSFQWAESVKTYGEAGTKELAAVFVPKDADTYGESHPLTVSVTVARKPVSITVNAPTKVYGTEDPELTYDSTQTVEGYSLTGKLERMAGEDVGTYEITLGTLNDENNPNYTITINSAPVYLTITPAECTQMVTTSQTVLQGVGLITEPAFKGVKEETLTGTLSYSYGDLTDGTYGQLTEKLKALNLDATGEVTYSFVPESNNYESPVTGTISFTVKDIEFVAGTAPVALGNGVTVKEAPVYGDTWADIVTIMGITAQAGSAKDSDISHFTLNVTGMPDAGNDIPFVVLYNGSLNGKTYTDVEVCGGTVNLAKRSITVAAGTYQVSKEYDGTTDPGTASGVLAVDGILDKDTGVSVTAAPVVYTSANVGGQAQMTLPLTLDGTGAGNYVLAEANVVVPCVITPKTITPAVEITGTYSYTGNAVIPALTVKNGTQVMAAADYEVVLSDNINAGTAKVTVSPKAGGNYTWSAVEESFVIDKTYYPGERTASTATRYGNTGIFNLTNLLPEGSQVGAITVTDNDGILEGTPSLSGTQLSYKLVADRAKVGKTAVVTLPVTETLNYDGFDLVITVSVYDKQEQAGFAFQDTALNKIYGDADFTAAVINAAPGSSFTFTSSNPAVATVDNNGLVHIIKTGDATITVNASETADYMAASATCTLTVVPKALAWDLSGLSAVDRIDTVQGGHASLYGELKVAGILESDNAEAMFNCPAEMLTGTYTNVAAGGQDVLLAWKDTGNPAILQGAKAENYTLPSVLPSITGKINEVIGGTASIPESTTALRFSITLEGGISQVPEAFKNMGNLNTPEKLEAQMTQNVQTVKTVQNQIVSIPKESTVVYDVSLLVSINGGEWQPASMSNFPVNGLTVTLAYPAGTGQDSHDFVVCHLFTEDINGYHAGEAEYPEVTKTAEGISFKVNGLSPISVAWTAAGTLGNVKAGGAEDEEEETVVDTPAVNSQIKSPKTGDTSFRVWPYVAVILSIDLAVYVWQRRRSRADS